MSALEVPTTDPEAVFRSLYESLHGKVLNHVRHKVNDPEAAEDICQEVWAKLSVKLPEYLGRPDFNGPALVYQAATNKALDHLRRGQSAAAGGRVRWVSMDGAGGVGLPGAPLEPDLEAALTDALSPEALAVADDERRRVRGQIGLALEGLSVAHRRALWLRYYHHLTQEAVGVAVGISTPAAKSLLMRARQACAEALRAEATRTIRGQSTASRIAARTVTRDPDACWTWTGAMARRGQEGGGLPVVAVGAGFRRVGRAKIVLRNGSVIRVLRALAAGPIAPWSYVGRTCQNPVCVNPGHIAVRAGQGGYAPPEAGLEAPHRLDLAVRRRRLGLSQREVGVLLGHCRSIIETVECGYRTGPAGHLAIRVRYGELLDRLERERAAGGIPPDGIAARRRVLGLTQAQLGAAVGLPREVFGRVERGVPRPGLDVYVAAVNSVLNRLERERAEGSAA